MKSRINIYFNEETYQKFEELKKYLEGVGGPINRQGQNNSATIVILIDTFHKLFLEADGEKNYFERLAQLEKNLATSDEGRLLKSIRRQLDKLLYLELTNFHSLTKGPDFDIQDLESIHSKFDPTQHELMSRIEDIIKEDAARGQTIKHSH